MTIWLIESECNNLIQVQAIDHFYIKKIAKDKKKNIQYSVAFTTLIIEPIIDIFLVLIPINLLGDFGSI